MNVDGIQNVGFCFTALQLIPKPPKHGPPVWLRLLLGYAVYIKAYLTCD